MILIQKKSLFNGSELSIIESDEDLKITELVEKLNNIKNRNDFLINQEDTYSLIGDVVYLIEETQIEEEKYLLCQPLLFLNDKFNESELLDDFNLEKEMEIVFHGLPVFYKEKFIQYLREYYESLLNSIDFEEMAKYHLAEYFVLDHKIEEPKFYNFCIENIEDRDFATYSLSSVQNRLEEVLRMNTISSINILVDHFNNMLKGSLNVQKPN